MSTISTDTLPDNQGRVVTLSGTIPAAGAEIADTVPVGSRWRLWAIEVVLVAAAVAVSRSITLFIDDAGSTVTRRIILKDTTAQTTGQTITHHWSPGTEANDANSVAYTDTVNILAKFPMSLQKGILLFQGYNIRTITANLQGADQYGAARYIVEDWAEP